MTETNSILIKDTTILSDSIIKGSVLVVDNKIEEISTNLVDKDADIVINGQNKITMPGLINTHSHVAMTLLRGVGDDQDLQTWLNEYIWPREAKLNEELVYAGSKLAMAEMIKTGTIMFNDMYFYMEETAKAVEESGMRALLGYGMIDLFDEEKRKSELNETKKFIDECHNTADGRVQVAVAPHAPYTCSEEILKESKKLADTHNLKLHIHVSETKQEVTDLQKERNETPFEYLNNIGLLDENTIAAHGVWTTPEEMKILKEKNVSISHNPSSNMKLASGIAPINDYIKNGINVGIGTDGVSSNNNLDMFSEMKLTALLQKVNTLDPKVLPAKETFDMATKNGAKALGVNSGEIKEGKLADIIIVNTNVPHMTPVRNPLSNIIYSALGTDVDTVICDGKILMENKELKTINEKEVISDAINAAAEL
ncbi:amidohydrolase family protein [Candidatus Methanosphaera massiliense]|jgi:5-methylthioadenosine/S-adenosylhomocysteine deaminase|uniref:amidohydrolase family protein n=1 Tax=Methanosphaera TaxID=2316 RepID=UPI002380A07E|nr:amidohydrolase family protein [Candidatus Methanosphaera massiliense]MDE4078207.1 amidohydrolase family protein [Candidatus Methanosphaera massiliense]